MLTRSKANYGSIPSIYHSSQYDIEVGNVQSYFPFPY
jgi:hypothetical protein